MSDCVFWSYVFFFVLFFSHCQCDQCNMIAHPGVIETQLANASASNQHTGNCVLLNYGDGQSFTSPQFAYVSPHQFGLATTGTSENVANRLFLPYIPAFKYVCISLHVNLHKPNFFYTRFHPLGSGGGVKLTPGISQLLGMIETKFEWLAPPPPTFWNQCQHQWMKSKLETQDDSRKNQKC